MCNDFVQFLGVLSWLWKKVSFGKTRFLYWYGCRIRIVFWVWRQWNCKNGDSSSLNSPRRKSNQTQQHNFQSSFALSPTLASVTSPYVWQEYFCLWTNNVPMQCFSWRHIVLLQRFLLELFIMYIMVQRVQHFWRWKCISQYQFAPALSSKMYGVTTTILEDDIMMSWIAQIYLQDNAVHPFYLFYFNMYSNSLIATTCYYFSLRSIHIFPGFLIRFWNRSRLCMLLVWRCLAQWHQWLYFCP
jgi:hypothetical protein